MKDLLITFIITVILTGGAVWLLKPPEVIDRTSYEQEKLDSLTAIIRARTATSESLKDSLEHTTESFQNYVSEHQGQVAALTSVRGKLRTRIDQLSDSLEAAQSDIHLSFMCEEQEYDTTFVYTRTFSDSLFRVESHNNFTNGIFNDSLSTTPIRDLRMDVAILVSEDRRTVEALATSTDLDSLRVSSQTEIEPPEPEPLQKAINYTAIAVVIFEAVQAVKSLFGSN